MPMINSRLHGIIDYIVGLALIAAPWLFGFVDFNHFEAATWTPIILGAMIIVMSLMTNYEMSAAKIIPFKTHLMMDVMTAVILGASPWVFNYATYVYKPHVIVAIAELLVVLMTVKQAYTATRNEPLINNVNV